MLNNLLADLQKYQKSDRMFNEELPMFDRLISFIQNNINCFERSNTGHITSSIFIVNSDGSKALLTHHKKLNNWFQLGGHNDGDSDCRAVAFKEAQEESGIQEFIFLTPDIFDIDIHPIPSACAYHYDIRFLLQAKHDTFLVSEESHSLAWVAIEELSDYTSERSVMRMAEKYKKFINQ